MSLDAPRCSAHGRFKVAWVDGGMTMTARGVERAAVSAAIRFGSLGLLVIVTPILAWSAPALGAASMTALVVFAAVAARAAWQHIAGHRIFERGVWSRMRRLTVEPPPAVAADYREAPPHMFRVVLDGVPLDPTDPPNVSVTSSFRDQVAGKWRPPRTLYSVNLVFRSHIVRVESFVNAPDALALASELRQALGLEGREVQVLTMAPFETTRKGASIGILLLFAHVLPAVAAIRWALSTDFADDFASRLAIACLAVALSGLVVQALALAFSVSLVTEATQETFGIELDVSPSRRWARTGAVAWSIASIGLAVFLLRSSTATGTFRAGSDRLLVVDIEGQPAILGWAQDERGLALGAFDAKTGARRWRWATADALIDLVSSGGRTAIAYGTSVEFDPSMHNETSVVAFDTATGAKIWSSYFAGAVDRPLFVHGCVVMSPGLFGDPSQDLDEATGSKCRPEGPAEDGPRPDAEPPPSDPGGRATYWVNRMGDLGKRADAIEGARKAQAPRDMNAKRASLEVDGTVYDIDATQPRLLASATRGGHRIWRTPLPAQDLFGLPFAVGAGVVLVAGSEHRADGERALRLVALDAATGRIRFVQKHDRRTFGSSTDVVIAAGTGIVVWADELLGYDLSSGRVSWSVGEAP
jgi:hypothetical protein